MSYSKKSMSYDSCKDNSHINPLAELLFSLQPKQFSLLASLIGILLIDNLDSDQQNALGNFIVSVGQAILTSAAQSQSLQGNSSQNNSIKQKIEMIKKQICDLEREYEKSL